MSGCNFCLVFQVPCDGGQPCGRCLQRGHPHLCSGHSNLPAFTAGTTTTASSATPASPQPGKKKRACADQAAAAPIKVTPARREAAEVAELDGHADVEVDGRAEGGAAFSTTLEQLSRAVARLTAEVKRLGRENDRLRDQLTAMASHQAATSRALSALASAPKPSPEPTPASSTALLSPWWSRVTSPSTALVYAMRELPFLRDYFPLSGFAVPDFRWPLLTATCSSVYDFHAPTITYVNPAMCQLTGYSWDQLIGSPLSMVLVMQDTYRQHLGPNLVEQEPLSISREYHFHHLVRTKSGHLWRAVVDNTWFFFDENGEAKHGLVSLVQWREGALGQGEVLDYWTRLPPNPEPDPPP